MSGHSKWATIKRKKGKLDAQRGRVFTKLIKEITVAAREGGGDQEANPRLRTAVATAKAANMPADNIKRAIKKGTGELPGTTYEEAHYEGYGPGGVAVLVKVLTDNKNRTVAEIRHIFTKNGGSLGEAGCVGWMFDKKGYITVDFEKAQEDSLMEQAIEAGAIDFSSANGIYEIYTEFAEFDKVRAALESKKVELATAEISQVPQSTIKLEGKHAEQMIRLFESLEEHEDVQQVFANFDIDEKIMEQLTEQQ
jgi:YebC/PmpR family DNA-binding regulatory protein